MQKKTSKLYLTIIIRLLKISWAATPIDSQSQMFFPYWGMKQKTKQSESGTNKY